MVAFAQQTNVTWGTEPAGDATGNLEGDQLSLVIRFGLVDAFHLFGGLDPMFDVFNIDEMRRAWERWLTLGQQAELPRDPYESVKIATLEVAFPFSANDISSLRVPCLAAFEKAPMRWELQRELDRFEARLSLEPYLMYVDLPSRKAPAAIEGRIGAGLPRNCPAPRGWPSLTVDYYANDFMASIKAVAHLHKLSKKASSGAKAIHSLNYLPQLTAPQFDQLIANRSADALGIYDVGQGSAVALCKAHPTGHSSLALEPTIFVDVGAPSNTQQSTLAPGTAICLASKPLVILTHFHQDHYRGQDRGHGQAATGVLCDWVVPATSTWANVSAMLTGLVNAGRTVVTVPRGVQFSGLLQGGRRLILERGLGATYNGSGIVVAVWENPQESAEKWLLTGDCDYADMPTFFSGRAYDAVVVPHHGGIIRCVKNAVPPAYVPSKRIQQPVPPTWSDAKLVFSFGHGNTYQHPKPATWAAHGHAGWKMLPTAGAAGNQAWISNLPGLTGAKRGVAIGWGLASGVSYLHFKPPGCATCLCAFDNF